MAARQTQTQVRARHLQTDVSHTKYLLDIFMGKMFAKHQVEGNFYLGDQDQDHHSSMTGQMLMTRNDWLIIMHL